MIGIETGLVVLFLFGTAMILATWLFARKISNSEDFLMAGRKVPWWLGSASIAASWLWAPALFVSSQMSYELGLPGIFWFVFPNILAVILFMSLAPKIREKFPEGYTFPQFMSSHLKDEKIHRIYFFGYSFYQLMAVAVQLFVGSSLIYLLTGIPLEISILLLSAIVLTYSWISGLKASISTDLIQLGFIFLGLAVIIPMVLAHSGGLNSITKGIGGITGEHTNLFDPAVAFSFGLVTSIGLIAGAIADQQFWQRTFAFDKKSIKSGFLAGALLFGLVPITLSSLGFIAAGSGMLIPQGTDPSMVGVLAVAGLLPEVFLVLFFVMLLAGLTSTLDSGLSAFSSLYSVDIKKYTLSEDLSNPRAGMIIILFAGIAVALTVNYIPAIGLKQLWWIFNAVAAALIIPTVLSLYWDKLTSKGARYGIISALIIGLPLFVYGNFIDNSVLIVVSAVLILALNLLFCWVFRKEEIKGAGRISQPNQDVS